MVKEDKSQYAGTVGLTNKVALNRIREISQSWAMGTKEQPLFEESMQFIESSVPEMTEKSKMWDILEEEDMLTAKQWKKLFQVMRNNK